MGIERLDKNFAVETTLDIKDMVYHDVKKQPFSLYGFAEPERFCRMPMTVAKSVSDRVAELARHTSGGRIAFQTNSDYIALKAEISYNGAVSNMPLTGTAGFDMYIKENGKYIYTYSFKPPMDFYKGYETVCRGLGSDRKEIIINFPLYNTVDECYIGIKETAELKENKPYRDILPIVFYGSSITQGGCASRPGNTYMSILSREYGFDFVNLGFSGSAHGEEEMSEYIASLKMSCFVMDYDHNDGAEQLKIRHLPFYEKIRMRNPDLPIIIMTAPDYEYNFEYNKDWHEKKRQVIYDNYKLFQSRGDRVYFVDGKDMFGTKWRDCATVDRCHPNDFGFYKMAEALQPALEWGGLTR